MSPVKLVKAISTMIRKRFFAIFLQAFLPILLLGCAYRFTNSDRALSTSNSTSNNTPGVAVEGIFDTSRHTFAKDILWREIQRAFGSTGKVRLSSVENADVLIRIHLEEANFIPSPGKYNPNVKEPENPYIVSTVAPSSYPSLTNSFDAHSTGESVNYSFQVEAWKLGSGEQIFQKSYHHSFSYDIADRRSPHSATTISKENMEAGLTQSAQNIARRVYLDLLNKL